MTDSNKYKIANLVTASFHASIFISAVDLAIEDLRTKTQPESSKPHATAKRASMDLTNALVKVRNPI